MKLKNGIEIVSLDGKLARVRLLSPFRADDIRTDRQLAEKLKDPAIVSQWGQPAQQKQDNFNFQKVGDILPRSEDYILVRFRALSKVLVEGHWLDWTKDNVLQESVKLLENTTVYPNHEFWDINNWLGSVSQAEWDAEGQSSEGVPGINAEYKIDALMNPRIARGLLMSPPAIHSTSMTVLFEFDYSHPEMAAENQYKFFANLGEEIDGEIVRLIVTKVREYWDASLVFQGADRLAKKIGDTEEEDFAKMTVKKASPANSNEEKTMKLTKEQKAELGIEFDGEDVPETELLKAGESLAAKLKEFDGVKIAELKDLRDKAKAGEAYIEKQRDEVVRLAKLAELGSAEGDLDEVISQGIEKADFDTLVKLETYYDKKAAERFPKLARSSQEDSAAVEAAGGVTTKTTTVPKVGLH